MKAVLMIATTLVAASAFAATTATKPAATTTTTTTTTKVTTTATAPTMADGLTLIHAGELETMMKEKNTFVFDANTAETRKENGVVPGATKLDNSHAYAATVLPTDKNARLVFYCANEQCMASHDAAKRAKTLGYTHVAVMSDGIKGWKAAGHPTQAN